MAYKGRALHVPLAPHDGTTCSPINRPGGLQGTDRFGGSGAAPNPCYNDWYIGFISEFFKTLDPHFSLDYTFLCHRKKSCLC